MPIKKFLFVLLAPFFLSGVSFAQMASDNADNYIVTGWANEGNGGAGFNPWGFDSFDAADDTAEIADSSVSAGNINSPGGGAFRIASNNGGSLDVIRSLGEGRSLGAGDVFSFDMTLNFRNGNKGFDLRNEGTTVFNFNVGGDQYMFGGVNLSDPAEENWGYVSDGIYQLEFAFITETSMRAKIQRSTTGGGTLEYEIANVALANPVNNFKFYISGTDSDSTENSLYFNNLNVVPEPGVYALVTGVAVLLFVSVRRRRCRSCI